MKLLQILGNILGIGKDALNNRAELKKLIASTNIKGYSKLPKPELIKLMLRAEHIDRFKSVKMKAKRSAPVSEKDQKQKKK